MASAAHRLHITVSEDQFEIPPFSNSPSRVNHCVFSQKVNVWEEELGDESWKEV
jgi:hypothetical protein